MVMHGMAMGLGHSAMVVKELSINDTASDTPQVHIKARKSGLVAFILALLGIDPTVTFDVYPLSAISAAVTGFTKPILLIVIAVIVLILGLFQTLRLSRFDSGMGTVTFVATLVIALILIILYFLRKTLLIGAITHGGPSAILVVKSSVIEGVKVDQELAQKIIAIINRNIMEQTTR